MSFKDWKERQTRPQASAPIERKQVRFNDPAPTQLQSLPTITSTNNNLFSSTAQSTLSLPSNLQLRPPISRGTELSICESSQTTPIAMPNINYMPSNRLYQQQQIQPAPPFQQPVGHCNCQPPPQPVISNSDVQQQMLLMQQQFVAMQEQVNHLQRQVTQLLQIKTVPTPHSPPTPRAVTRDSSTQYTIYVAPPEPSRSDAAVNTTQIPATDQTFFNQVLGQVNQILQQTDDSRLNSGEEIKFIESDVSAESIAPKKRSTDKSTCINALAEKYLGKSMENGLNALAPGTLTPLDIDVSTTCYNYLRKYDLLKNYSELEEDRRHKAKLL